MQREPGSRWAGLLAWLAALAVVAYVVIGNAEPTDKTVTAEQASKLPPAGMIEMLGKAIVGDPNAESRKNGLNSVGMFAASPSDRVRAAILVAEVNGTEEGLKKLDEAAAGLPQESLLATEAALLRRLIEGGPGALSEEERAGIDKKHGWLGRLALSRGKDSSDAMRKKVVEDAEKTIALMLGAAGVGVLGGVVALGCVVFGIVWLALGKVRRAYVPSAAGGTVFIEVFALFLLGFLGVSFASHALSPYLGEGVTGWFRWALLLIPLGWPLFRGMSWEATGRAVGWTTGRGVLWEVLSGVVGYLACMPVVALGLGLTLVATLINRAIMGPESGSPSHPLGEMLARADFWQMVQLVLLATVWAPVVEETVFRGAFYHHLRGRLWWPVAGLVQAFFFAVIHPQGWMGVPVLMSIGFTFSMLREWRGSCIANMTAHALNNGTITILLLVILKAGVGG